MDGAQQVPVVGVAWDSKPISTVEALLIWCVELPQSFRKRDVSVPAGRLFFHTRVWKTAELAELGAKLRAMKAEVSVDVQVAQRLDGGLRGRIARRRGLEERIRRLERALPHASASQLEVPGGLTTAREGHVTVARTAARLPFGPQTQYGVVGTFQIAPA